MIEYYILTTLSNNKLKRPHTLSHNGKVFGAFLFFLIFGDLVKTQSLFYSFCSIYTLIDLHVMNHIHLFTATYLKHNDRL